MAKTMMVAPANLRQRIQTDMYPPKLTAGDLLTALPAKASPK